MNDIKDRFEVTIITGDTEESHTFAGLEEAYEFYRNSASKPAEVALHDLDNSVTITDNTYESGVS